MLIIVDGPDCVGKTTLVGYVENVLLGISAGHESRVTVLHSGPPRDHPLDEYVKPLLTYRPGVGQHIVCDRWHLGELVYPRVLDRPTRMTPGVFRYVDLFLRSRGALLVTVTASAERIADCLGYRGDDLVNPDHATALRDGFIAAELRSGLNSISVLSDEIDQVELPHHIVGDAARAAEEAYTLNDFTTYVGARWPKLLLLGDVRATGKDSDDPRPAFMPYGATSGAYLLDALADDLRVGVGIANACDVDDPWYLWHVLGRPNVVALGRNAREVTPWAVRHVPHPQWIRRFHYGDRNSYRAQILGLTP